MKKIKKYIFLGAFIIAVICQICCIAYSYSIYEIKQMTNFKTVEQDGEPEKYDVLIDAKDLIYNEKIPAGIKSTINDVLYSEKGIFNIDFFGKKSSSTGNGTTNNSEQEAETEKLISDIVKIGYKILLYVTMAAMITLLIYIAIMLVSSGMIKDIDAMPFSDFLKNNKNEMNPGKKKKPIKLVEQWTFSVIALGLSAFIINSSVYFSNIVNEALGNNKLKDEPITIYVKNSVFSKDAPILGNIEISSNTSNTSNTEGDSNEGTVLRNKVIEQANSLDTLGLSGGLCEMWVEKCYETALGRDIDNQCCAHSAALAAKNVSSTEDNIVPGAAVFSYRSSNPDITNCSTCGRNPGHVGIYVGDGKIASCGNNGILICTIEEWKKSWDFSCWGWLSGTEDLANGTLTNSNTSTETTSIDYYFDTNLEGMLAFQSQYNEEHKMKNFFNMAAGLAITLFKIFLYFVFVFRTLALAIITIASPILILINAYKQTKGEKGFLKNLFIIYIYLVFLKPILGFLYYILAGSNTYLVSEFPIYILLVIVIIFIIFIESTKKIMARVQTTKKTNAAKKKTA